MNEEIKPENLRIHSRADELIACLEGEIAKRDETIARLEPQLNRAIQANYDLREELAACRIAVENCDLFRARIAEMEDDLKCAHSMLCEVSKSGMVLRAELAATKAQGVVMPEKIQQALDFSRNFADSKPDIGITERQHILGLANLLEKVARLNAAPVQQVSVPDGSTKMQWPEIVALVNEVLGCEAHKYPCERGSIGHEMTGINFNSLARIIDRVLSAATAAPAADAGIVDMYRHLQKVTPYRFKKIQDASITDGGDVMYFHKDRFDAALLADMAAHCAAKGVV